MRILQKRTVFFLATFISLSLSAPLQPLSRWLLDAKGRPIPPPVPGGRMMGLQTSGLSFDGELLWSVVDQRSNFPAHALRIDPHAAKLVSQPIRLRVEPDTAGEIPRRLIEANPDLEGIAVHPREPTVLYIAVESDGPFVLECRYAAAQRSIRVIKVLHARFDLKLENNDLNSGFEGIATDGEKLYLAYERDAAGWPHVYAGLIPAEGTELPLAELPIPFPALPGRPGKGGLNINGLDLLAGESPVLILLARDQERLLFYEPDKEALSYADLDLRDPQGETIYWVSPEGVAVDAVRDRLWIINDPDSVQSNYRRRSDQQPRDYYELMVPLLFELSLSEIRESQALIPVEGTRDQ